MKYLKIFTDFLDVTASLSDGALGRLFRAMLRYAREGAATELKGKEAVAWVVAKQHIDREAEAYENMVEARREAGRRSGQARKQKEQAATTTNKTNQDKDKEKEKDNDKDKDKDKERERIGAAPPKAAAAARARAMPPSLEEIVSYCEERGNRVNAQRFWDFYTANGWKVGKNPMQDWKAAVRSWETNGVDDARPAPAREKMTDREVFQKAIELHRMKEATPIPFP